MNTTRTMTTNTMVMIMTTTKTMVMMIMIMMMMSGMVPGLCPMAHLHLAWLSHHHWQRLPTRTICPPPMTRALMSLITDASSGLILTRTTKPGWSGVEPECGSGESRRKKASSAGSPSWG
jgi:hypothetical protein